MILLELIFVIVLLSIIFSTTTKFLFTIMDKNRFDFTTNLTKIEFETTKLFLTNLLHKTNNLNTIKYKNDVLLYNNILLQNNVKSFKIVENNGIYTVDICINLQNNICQTWIIK